MMIEALTREATALRVTIMIGHTGRYFEIKRAVEPLRMCQLNKDNTCTDLFYLVVNTRMAPAFISRLPLTADIAVDSSRLTGFWIIARMSLNKLT